MPLSGQVVLMCSDRLIFVPALPVRASTQNNHSKVIMEKNKHLTTSQTNYIKIKEIDVNMKVLKYIDFFLHNSGGVLVMLFGSRNILLGFRETASYNAASTWKDHL